MSHFTSDGSSNGHLASCPAGCVCDVRDMIRAAQEAGTRRPTEIDNGEMRTLLGAVRDGYDTVRRDPRIVPAQDAVDSAFRRARRALDLLRATVDSGKIAEAAQLAREKQAIAARGPRRATWLRVVRWPVVFAVGAFETWYFMQVFSYLTSYEGDAEAGEAGGLSAIWERIIPIVPGIALAIALAVSGALLLMPLRAWRDRAHRPVPDPPPGAGRTARLRVATARALRTLIRLAWWTLPVLFAVTLLGVVAYWAGLRALYPQPPAEGYPLLPVMLLLVMISLAAIVTKILADDPVADEAASARRRLFLLRCRFEWRLGRADRHLARYRSALRRARGLRDDLAGLLRMKMLSAWADHILRIRALHQAAGPIAPAPQAHPAGLAEALEELDAVIREIGVPEFEGIRQPRPEPGLLLELCRVIDELEQQNLETEREAIVAAYRRQLAPRGEARGELALERGRGRLMLPPSGL